MLAIDLNADVGEGFDADADLIPLVSTVNIACGFHAGDARTMRDTLARARDAGVRVMAHPSFRDREHFGRRDLDISLTVLRDDLAEQWDALHGAATTLGVTIAGIKPHGALYHRAARDADVAALVLALAAEYGVSVVSPPHGELIAGGRSRGVPVLVEGFADRAYQADGSLVDRSQPGAVHSDPQRAAAQAVQLATTHRVDAVGGDTVPVAVDTLCVHGDAPGAVATARAVRAALESAGVAVRAGS